MAGRGRRLNLARRAAAAAAAAVLAAGVAPARGGLVEALLGDHGVRIVRTGHGVAHVEAADDEGLGYGIGYAHAQDDACALADLLVTLRGERSFWFGGEGSGTLGQRTLPNRVIDLFIRAHMDDVRIAQAWQGASREAQARALGFVEGFDRYLEDARGRLPAACAGKGWVQPMTLAELLRAGELMAIEAGLGAWADALVAAQPPRRDGAPTRPAWMPAPPVDDPADPLAATRLGGSGALAFGRDGSASGRGLLLAYPHQPWQGLDRFWQVHLTIPGELDAMGVTKGPLPWLAIGFNRSVAWSQTASAGRRFTLHELQLVPGNPTAYVVDGHPEQMSAHAVRVSERGPDGRMQTEQQLVWSSRYGPVVVAPTIGLLWTPAVAYALQDVNVHDGRYADTWRGIERAGNVGELRDALSRQGMAQAATVAADRGGFVLFADASGVPDVDEPRAPGCAVPRAAAWLWKTGRILVLDGSRSACDWTRDPASASPGAIPWRRMPQMMRTDWLADGGSGYWLANPMSPLTGYPPLAGAEGVPQRLDTRFALREAGLREDVRGVHRRVGVDDLSAILFSNRVFAADLVLDDLLAACRDAPTEATRAGCAVLARWDRTDDASSRGAQVFREFWRRARGLPGLWRVPFDREDPIRTPAGLDLGPRPAQLALRDALFDALGQGVHALREAGFAIDAPLGELQRHASPAGSVALSGGEEGEGVLNALGESGLTPLTRRGYDIDQGTSWLQLVDFADDGPRARGLLVYGQSSNPASPFAFDQLPAYAARQWFELPFDAADVAAQRVGEPLALRFYSGMPQPQAPRPKWRPQ
jgi:acyl-homoserine-lactone acylase